MEKRCEYESFLESQIELLKSLHRGLPFYNQMNERTVQKGDLCNLRPNIILIVPHSNRMYLSMGLKYKSEFQEAQTAL